MAQFHECHPLHKQVHSCCQLNSFGPSDLIIFWVQVNQQVMQIEIIMRLHIIKNLARCQIGAQLTTTQNGFGYNIFSRLSAHITSFQTTVDFSTLYRIALGIIEKANPWQLISIVLLSLVLWRQARSHVPTFTIKQNPWINFIHFFSDDIHGGDIMDSHQIKTEAIHIEFFYPVAK